MQSTPYTPGDLATDVPGREAELEAIENTLILARERQRLVGRVRVEVGPRGVGKTSMLREAQRRASADGWQTVFLTAGQGALVSELSGSLARGPLKWEGDFLRDHLTELQLSLTLPGAGAKAKFAANEAPPGAVIQFEELVRKSVTASIENAYNGLVIFIDELQSADLASLRTILYAWQHFQAEPDGLPLALIAAGLGHTEDVVTEAASFAERVSYVPVRSLEAAKTREALTLPSTRLGVTWRADALEVCVERSQGYPYFIQLYGDAAWAAAGNPDPGAQICLRDVVEAENRVEVDLTSLYRSRWAKVDGVQREMIVEMARIGETAQRGDIATAMGRETSAISVPRQRLLDKGIIESAGWGQLRFTVPGFREYVMLQIGESNETSA